MNPTRKILPLCLATAAIELALLLAIAPGPFALGLYEVVFLVFTLGPPVFLGLITWRRRATLPRPHSVMAIAIFVCVLGILLLGYDFVMTRGLPAGASESALPALMPILQWPPVLAVWLWLVKLERKMKLEQKGLGEPRPPGSGLA